MSTTGQAGPDMEAVKKLTDAIEHAARAYGVTPRVSTHWAVAWGSRDLNGGVGYVEQYDDEEDARTRAGQLANHPDFPEPVQRLAMGPVWLESDVTKFLDTERKPGRRAKDVT